MGIKTYLTEQFVNDSGRSVHVSDLFKKKATRGHSVYIKLQIISSCMFRRR